MKTLAIGQSAPDFSLPDMAENLHRLSEMQTPFTVVFFYPKDATPG